jgi:hypothetical protein
MNRRNLLTAALGLPLAPLAALAAPLACTGSPNWLRNAERGVPTYEFHMSFKTTQGSSLRALAESQGAVDGVVLVCRDGEIIWEAPK